MDFSSWQRCAALSGLLLLLACDPPVQQVTQNVSLGPLPKAVCADAAKALAALAKSGSFEHDRNGEATIDEDVWLALGAAGQDQLTKALAFDTACATGSTPREQQVHVRSAFGRTLSNRTVEVAADTDVLFDE